MNTTNTTNPTRRAFLRKSAAATFGFTVLPSYLALGKPDKEGNVPPSQRINLGVIGVGGRGSVIVSPLCSGGHAIPVAFCDVYFKAERATRNLKLWPGLPRFADFRVMLERMGDDIDAVSIATPDHTHFPAAMAAMRLGKHVYVEKPLTHTFREAEMLMAAEKKYGVVTQMGNQGHTSAGANQFQRLVEAGIIRDIVRIEGYKGRGGGPGQAYMNPETQAREYPAGQAVPEGMNWDLWAGPAEKKPYHPTYYQKDWRGFQLYGAGMLGDWAAHIIDFAHDYLQLGLPTRIEPLELVNANPVTYPSASKLSMHFPARGEGLPACDLVWSEGDGMAPKIDERYWDTNPDGKKKEAVIGGASTLLHRKDGDFLIQRGSHSAASRILPREIMLQHIEKMKALPAKLNHQQSFIQACLGNGETRSPFSVAAPLTQVLILGNICQRTGATLEFDPASKQFKNNNQANTLLAGPPPRRGWEEFYKEA